ncbi:MAG: LamG-like jellyroll fold domain-containing protein [Planctomycetota bacterium]|nr:LamG-like jellyroll fold domain-containing protein [Planctomycetota bacterium]
MLFTSSLLCSLSFTHTNQVWTFEPDTAVTYNLNAATFADASVGSGLICNADVVPITVESKEFLPSEGFTVSAWVAIEEQKRWGGIIGCVQDDAEEEYGWVLGYNQTQFTFGLSTVGADDGDGHLTYLDSASFTYGFGTWHHVVATYDGNDLKLYVDGELANTTSEQSGAILYSIESPFVLGGYVDGNENHPLDGRLREITLDSVPVSASQVKRMYKVDKELTALPSWTDLSLGFEVEPYLNWPTSEAISVSFETTVPTDASVQVYHESGQGARVVKSSNASLHHFRLTGLEPNAKYFYIAHAEDRMGNILKSERLSFRTAPTKDDSFTFVAIGDTQSQATVVKRVSDLAFMHRPNLVIHAGDLVSTGTVKSDWTGHFFPAMQPLIGRVPLMPVLGNHEQDAQHYYDYMVLPAPEMYYSFEFGNAEFFMIDGNRKLDESSKQLKWLESALKQSDSTWKFAVLHQPPYTSDSNDYGDTYNTTSTRGDTNVQNIISLLEKYGVDICFSGHVHDYERTFPILDGKVKPVSDGGVMYVTTAGGGGHLEHFDPTNTWFGHKKANYHHLVYIAIHGNQLEFQAIDEHGQLFDVMSINKVASIE